MAVRAPRVGYFDFFAGPGRYGTGEKSTPLLILEWAVGLPKIADRLVTIFNDANPEYTAALKKEIEAIAGIDKLKHEPQILTGELSDELVEQFEEVQTIPALSFIDPWGYKGLSMRLIHAVIKDWGCDVVFFFNYNRINRSITTPRVHDHMKALFGSEPSAGLKSEIVGMKPAGREAAIRRALEEALKAMGARYVIPFVFRRRDGRVSHYICFVSKHKLGFQIMKDIMAKRGAMDEDGVPLFEYIPETEGRQLSFEPRPLLSLGENLRRKFAGRTLAFNQLFDLDNVGTPFIERNYRKVLLEMEAQGEISCEPATRTPGTMGPKVRITFLPR